MHQSINIRGRLVDLSTPCVMGILNITDDSFYDGGRYTLPEVALARAEEMIKEGAVFIDVGGASSRPGAVEIPSETELSRIIPVVEMLKSRLPEALISIDTFRAVVAKRAVEAGADLINDISSGDMDIEMAETVGKLKVPYIAMHMKGTPRNMQDNPVYGDVVQEVLDYFINKKVIWDQLGLKDVIIDPGFGFGKTVEHNYRLLSALPVLSATGYPILAGLSRKSMINKVIGTTAADSLNGTSAAHMIALMRGANILRVHDVKEAVEVCRIYSMFRANDMEMDGEPG